MPSPRPVKPSFSLVVALTADAADGNAGDLGDARAHGVAMRRDARRFAHDRHVEMRDHAARARAPARRRRRENGPTTAPFHCGSLGGKCDADIAVGERAENGVDQRMQRHIGVRMPGHAARMRDAHAAEHDMIAVGEGVHVEAVAGAHIGQSVARCSISARAKSSLVVTFTLPASPSNTLTR